MAGIECPIECVQSGCPQPDFIERNGTWLITVIGLGTTCIGGVFAYFLKSRCTRIEFCGVRCDREVLALDAKDVGIQVDDNSNTDSPDVASSGD